MEYQSFFFLILWWLLKNILINFSLLGRHNTEGKILFIHICINRGFLSQNWSSKIKTIRAVLVKQCEAKKRSTVCTCSWETFWMVWQQPHESKPWQTSRLTPIFIKKKDYIIKNCDNEKLLAVTVDANLNSNCHLESILKKACKKVHVLARITPYMSIPKRKLLMNSFFTSQFNYCSLTWMCHSRTINNKINRLHESCLRIVHSDKTSSFEKLLEKNGSVTIHTRNL